MAKRGSRSSAKKMPAKTANVEKKPAKVISEEEGEDIDADLENPRPRWRDGGRS
jgi:hypothetical protein